MAVETTLETQPHAGSDLGVRAVSAIVLQRFRIKFK